jgi:hypothetical protein
MFKSHYKIFKELAYVLALVTVLAAPAVVFAISSPSYEIEPSGTSGVFHISTSTNYRLEGAIEPITGLGTTTDYSLEHGSSFPGLCGDGFLDPGEDCEGVNLNSKTCADIAGAGYTGSLSCTSGCTFSTSGCVAPVSSSGGGGGGGGGVSLSAPTFDNVFNKKSFTYKSEMLFYGYKPTDARDVYFNGSINGVTYPTTRRWNKKASLTMGKNILSIYAANVSLKSSAAYLTITRRTIGDINLDGRVNDYDLSLLANHWGYIWAEADFNEDGRVNDYDLSMLVAYWTN